jgi:dipeptidyl aminopeptidase/acylaminoacyl peptidase
MFRASLSGSLALLLTLSPMVNPLGGATPDKKFDLTIDNIMRGVNLVGTEPTQVRWSGDSSTIYFQWKKASDPASAPNDTYAVTRDNPTPRKLSDDEAHLAPPASVDTNRDQSLSVYAQDGDIVVIENATGKRRQVTKTVELETNPRFAPDGHHITFQRADNLYLLSLDDGDLVQLTDIHPFVVPVAVPAAGATGVGGRGRGQGTGQAQVVVVAPVPPTPRAGANGTPPKGTESQEYLKKEQEEFFAVVRDRDKLRKETEERQKKNNPRKPYMLQVRQTLAQMQLSPDGQYVLAILNEAQENSKNDDAPSWITDSSYPELLPGRPRVGDQLTQRHLVVINVVSGEVKHVDHSSLGAPVAEVEDGNNCGGRSGGGGGQAMPGVVIPPAVLFSDDGKKAVFSSRARDNKSCWILALETAAAKARVLFKDEDKAWLGGPGGGDGWLGDNQTFYFTSEHDGYNHLYEVPYDGGAPKQLTTGKFEIDRVELSHDKSRFYLSTSQGSFYERHLWSLPVQGGETTLVTKAEGTHVATISPDEKWVADIYSYTNKPPELYLQANEPNAATKKLTESPAPEFANFAWTDTPIVEIPARDGVKVPGHLYKSASFKKGGPAVIFVHGAGYAQNIRKAWPSAYFHEYMFHHFLRDHGYTVLDLDYRGSKGYGRDWRTSIYRHMGGTDLDDQVDAAKWLVFEHGVDPKRIGIYGGSYGGFITLMAMFTQPGVFAAGAALRPVSDWALYNQGYTGNILNFPQKDAEAYRLSSPIFFADGLKGALLICHGMVDTNVHFVDTVRLVERLIELHKDNWDLAVYPVEDHGFKEAASWTDEYKRIYKLFETNLKGSGSHTPTAGPIATN